MLPMLPMLPILSIGILVLAAGLGVYMANRVLGDVLAPWPAAALHGLLAATGVGLLVYVIWLGTAQPAGVLWGTGVLLVAVLGGLVLAGLHLLKRLPPQLVVVVHALVGILGVSLLVAGVVGVL